MQLDYGSAPASGAVSRASRLTAGARNGLTVWCVRTLLVRCEARRTAAGAAALPEKSTASFRIAYNKMGDGRVALVAADVRSRTV
jgi:hypothetical protein